MSPPKLPLSSLFAVLALALPAAVAIAADGDVDPTFASTSSWAPGWDRLDLGGLDETGVAVARSADGGFIVCLSVPGGGAGSRIGLYKLDRDGRRVATGFGSNGHVLKDAFLASVTDMTVDAQGRIVVVGSTPGPAGLEDFGVVRFNPDGSDDTGFVGDGGASAGFDDTSGAIDLYYRDRPMSVAAEPDGGLVVAGSVFADDDSDVRWGAIRFDPDGSYDGRVAGRFAQGQKAVGSKILRLAGGHYLVVGSTLVAANDTDFGARIIKPSLTVSSDYSDSGTFAFDVAAGDGSLFDYASDAAPMGQSAVVLAGVASERIAVTRILVLPDGGGNPASLALDADFVGGGVSTYPHNYVGPIDVTGTDYAYGTARTRAALRSDASIILTGRFDDSGIGVHSAIVTRLRADGTEDADFSPIAATRFFDAPTSAGGTSTDSGFGDVLIDAGRPVVIGTSLDSLGDTDGVITRLQSDFIFAGAFE